MEGVLTELEEREEELEALTAELRRRQDELEEREAEVAEREEQVERREVEVERAAQERAEEYLLEARGEVEKTIRRLEERYEGAASGEEGEGEETRSRAASEARAAVEEAVRERRESRPEVPGETSAPAGARADLEEGDTVRVASLDGTGELKELRDDRAVVLTNGIRLTVDRTELTRVSQEEGEAAGDRTEPTARRPESRPEFDASSEVDLRGKRTDEVEGPLLTALDAAIVSDLPRLRVIHGKGTGALRQRVRELLSEDDRIRGFREGGPGEGGSGVTIVELKEGGDTGPPGATPDPGGRG